MLKKINAIRSLKGPGKGTAHVHFQEPIKFKLGPKTIIDETYNPFKPVWDYRKCDAFARFPAPVGHIPRPARFPMWSAA
ncbi:MAG: hypothetical protein DRR06_17785 [Gammaproteobacteria bacterium]|nr:MAG: hypothetical protein DRR06_17785 [Gammaproteobacteria bacterium]